MKNYKFKILIILFFFFIPFFYVFAVFNSSSTNINLEVQTGFAPACNGNGICESVIGETSANCWTDCGCNNNGICQSERLENSSNCFNDCGGGVFISPPSIASPLSIYNFSIDEIALNSARISWKTKNSPALCKVFLGETLDFEKEIITEAIYSMEHSIEFINLSPQTAYYFKISCQDTNQNIAERDYQEFSTLSPFDFMVPANVRNLTAISGDKKINLLWKNPFDSDFKEVRILRNTKFYSFEPWQGILIYKGEKDFFKDVNLTNGILYYYTVFSYDKAGNYSSGAIISAAPHFVLEKPIKQPELPLPQVSIPSITKAIVLESFDFWLKGKKLPLIEKKKIEVKEKETLTISINNEKVTPAIETIMVVLEKGKEQFSFLLKPDKEQMKYLTDLVFSDTGLYSLTINLLNIKNQVLKSIYGELEIKKEKEQTEKTFLLEKLPFYEELKEFKIDYIWIGILLLIILLSIAFVIIK